MVFARKLLTSTALLLCTTSAFAVDTANLSVIGTIAPTACTATFAGRGVVDYGLIPTASLSATAETVLAEKTIGYSIACDAPISIGVSFIDNRASSVGVLPGWPYYNSYGLGIHNGTFIGAYSIVQDRTLATGDGAVVDMIQRNNPGEAWHSNPVSATEGSGVRIQSFAPTGTLVPGTYSVVTGGLKVIAAIAATGRLDLSSSVTLDGLATMTVRYL